ncbi:hypothetical protein K2173_021696 [Erythroxylum novogranatense]|uniref:YTH domain-containing family protein n=1 Tax=Erythroxylum novogranatense TaxID=1862640 RepID=A0AAV8TJ33_9ROSI|nr:hypothetical protein K2173_021696 [Erythroxylum novogranatense]
MSSDTAKENASVVDSSVTEWKHDIGNSDGLESPSYRSNQDGYPFEAERIGRDRSENSSLRRKGKLCHTRYFIIKSLNHHNIQLSVEKGIWATQVMNEPILEEAFRDSSRVILIFSVNMSGFFQGYAQMISTVGWRHDNFWSQGGGKNNPWGCSFKVKWLCLNDLPFQKTLHLKNPLNDYKPVKISRDCQELPEDVGEALCQLISGDGDADGMLKSFHGDDIPSKRSRIGPPFSLGDGEYNLPSLQMPWARTPIPYSTFFHQHHSQSNRHHLAQQGSNGVTFPRNLSFASGGIVRTTDSCTNRNLAHQVQGDVPSRVDVWGLSTESPLASTLTDDDFLDMTYEEYLEVHSRCVNRSNLAATGTSCTTKEPSGSSNDVYINSSLVSDQCRPCKRVHRSSGK